MYNFFYDFLATFGGSVLFVAGLFLLLYLLLRRPSNKSW